jgi:lipoprotein-anchoring transpeptidase ErfK/SrfK
MEKAMRRTKGQSKAVAVVVLMMAASKAMAAGMPAVQQPMRRIVVSIPDRKLALVDDGRVVKVYETAVGAKVSPSPTGTFEIVTRIPHPTYYHKGKVIGPGKSNPLGTRWLGLSLKGYGIHGTNVPQSIGHAASHGCIRLRNSDVEDLFKRVQAGDVVELHGERDEVVAQIFGTAPEAGAVAGGGVQ